MEVVLPIEIEVPTLRMLVECQIEETEWLPTKNCPAFNKNVKARNLKERDLVLKENRAPVHDPREKFKPSWMGSYIMKNIMTGGAVILMDLDGIEFTHTRERAR
ncbi:hypothetical protein ACSBR1_015515 [Camellia fascicularis]